MINKNKNKGFTLVELLVVITIMAILTILSFSSFKTVQVKARDSQRKSDLNAVSKALMMYYTDKGVFPKKSDFKFGDESPGFVDPTNQDTIYMRKTPIDPKNAEGYDYVYEVDPTFKSFNLFANLENKEDSQCKNDDGIGDYSVDGDNYCYGIASPNTIVDPSLF